MTAGPGTAVGVFQTRDQVEKAVQQLRADGFRDDQIGVVAKHTEAKTVVAKSGETNMEEGAGVGMASGAAIGGLVGLGVLAGVVPVIGPALLAGTLGTLVSNAIAGAAAAGLAGALIGFGIPEADAKYYENEVAAGRYVVTVHAANRYDVACRILANSGATTRVVQR